jgi:anthranilate phosphoribosyltransferase
MDAEIHPDIRGGAAAENAEELSALLNGGGRPGHRDAVALNAAGARVVAGKAQDVPEAWPMALAAIDGGAAKAVLEKLVAVSQSAP